MQRIAAWITGPGFDNGDYVFATTSLVAPAQP
jgi:hypothetical protein